MQRIKPVLVVLGAVFTVSMLPMAYAADGDVRQDAKDVRMDKKDIAKDTKDIRQDKREMQQDVRVDEDFHQS